jgi:hypothetical protein
MPSRSTTLLLQGSASVGWQWMGPSTIWQAKPPLSLNFEHEIMGGQTNMHVIFHHIFSTRILVFECSQLKRYTSSESGNIGLLYSKFISAFSGFDWPQKQ